MSEYGLNSLRGLRDPDRVDRMTDSNGDGLAGFENLADQLTQYGRLLNRCSHPRPGDKRDKLGIVDAATDVLVGQHLATASASETSRRICALPQIQRQIDAFEEALVIRIEDDARAE